MTSPFRSRYSRSSGAGLGIGIALIVLVVLVLGIFAFQSYNTKHNRTATVCSKESVSTKEGHEYRVYTSGGTFVVKDIYFSGTRFDSGDVYGRIKERTTYDIVYKGWRIPFLSQFPNIVELDPASEQHPEACD